MRRLFALCAFVVVLLFALRAGAHESRPAYLQIDEVAPDRYMLIWRTPLLSGARLPVVVQLPAETKTIERSEREFSDSVVDQRVVTVVGGLAGKRIAFVGLQATITDVLVRMHFLSGAESTRLVHPPSPFVEMAPSQSTLGVASAYLRHGVEHIFGGYDHLLFLFALVLLVRSRAALFKTVTAFTVAHSITLALAALDVVHVPGPPVEAAIALSIVLLALESVRRDRGERSMTAERPWAIAFCFGLLHGLGFASALRELGLPSGAAALALVAFNVGVEVGQLVFIAVVSLTLAAAAFVGRELSVRIRRFAPLAIGSLATFWLIERLASA